MKKNVILCDRCGKEISSPIVRHGIFKRAFRWSGYRNGVIIERKSYTRNYQTKTETLLNLCKDCDKLFVEFVEWMKSSNKAKSAE